MSRCLELAQKGLGKTLSNPLVGSVVVHENEIIGEGFHEYFGGPHAEVNAVASVNQPALLPKSTLYVNLEPCAHFGKTPPCADFIIQNEIPRVVIGTVDPFSQVNGKGIKRLMENGIDVIVGVLETECNWLNRRFFTLQSKKRPYIILKWAQTNDGFVDLKREENATGINWITSQEANIKTHQWRREEMAILVGRNTVVNDNPSLTVRHVEGSNPLRVVIDPQGKSYRPTAHVFNNEAKTVLFTNAPIDTPTIHVSIKPWFGLPQMLEELGKMKITSLLVEGGRTTLQHFIDAELWDECRIWEAPVSWGEGQKSPNFPFLPDFEERVGVDSCKTYFNTSHRL